MSVVPSGSVPSEAGYGFDGQVPVATAFLFEVDGVAIGTFSEISGLEVRVEVATYQEGGENGFVHQLPGRMSWSNITLRRGVTKSDALFDWVNRVNAAKVGRSTGAITAIGTDGKTRLRSWNLQGVLPIRWTGPKFAAGELGALEEELEIAHDGITAKTF
jgi:phage tail-like protein